jgi:proline iminopeptidase
MIPALLVLFFAAASQTASLQAEGERQQLRNGDSYAVLNGFRIHYEVRGRGPVCIALTNSWGFTAEGLRAVLQPIEDRLTVIYFDPRGMGKSDAVKLDSDMSMKAVREDANALREYLKLNQAIFIGWSNGAANLMKFAAAYPDTVRAAILLHGAGYFSPEDGKALVKEYPELFKRYFQFQQEMSASKESTEEKDRKTRLLYMEEYFPYLFSDRAGARDRLRKMFGATKFSWRRLAYCNGEQQCFDARQDLPRIKAPVLVIAGARDMLPLAIAKTAAEAIPNATFVVFENSGHFAPVEEREKFIAVISGFLKHIQ